MFSWYFTNPPSLSRPAIILWGYLCFENKFGNLIFYGPFWGDSLLKKIQYSELSIATLFLITWMNPLTASETVLDRKVSLVYESRTFMLQVQHYHHEYTTSVNDQTQKISKLQHILEKLSSIQNKIDNSVSRIIIVLM